MSYEGYESLPDVEAQASQGLPDVEAHAIIAVDASATMFEVERKTGKRKHLCVAARVQEMFDLLDDPQYADVCITIVCFSADPTGVKIVTLVEGHHPHLLKTYTGNTKLEYWDGLSPANRAQGMGNQTPIGSALAWARLRAQEWVNAAPGQVQRRVVIYVLSDGMNNVGPDGRDEKKAIADFNLTCEKGEIRLASIGYFQSDESPSGTLTNPEEEEGRQLLRELPLNPDAYFETDKAEEIVGYVLWTITQVLDQDA
jgi:hypothetical protein